MGDVARKVMGDVPISYVEGVGGTRVSEDEVVAVGKHDVRERFDSLMQFFFSLLTSVADPVF